METFVIFAEKANMTSLKDIGQMLKEERISKGITQEQLGKLLGVGKAQISKIENGSSLNINTVNKVLDALELSASVQFNSTQSAAENVVGYCVAAINEFADAHQLTVQEASNYLVEHKGIDFLTNHYEAEHQQSWDDAVSDLTLICQKNGGKIK